MNKLSSKKSLYEKSSIAEIDTPQRNLHYLHLILIKKYLHFLDKNFFIRFSKNEFHNRRGELYICALIQEFNVVELSKFSNNHGPDFGISFHNDFCFYLESIVPIPEEKQDSEHLLKSLKTSIQRKKDKHKKWVYKKIITNADIFVLYIGLYGFDNIMLLHWNIIINYIFKILSDPRMNYISAILLSKDCEQIVMSTGNPVLFNDLRLIHNPLAINPLPLNSINVYQEYVNSILIREKQTDLTILFEERDGEIISHKIKDHREMFNIE